jgi:membrane protein
MAPRLAPLAPKRLPWRRYRTVLEHAGQGWIDDRAATMGAALSYYTVFSIAPLLLIVTAVAGLFSGKGDVREAIALELQGLIGSAGARAVDSLLTNVAHPGKGIVATVVGVAVLLVGATSVFAELQDDLNRIWHAPAPEKVAGWWSWLRKRLLSMGLILAIAFLLLVSLAASAAFDAASAWSSAWLGGWEGPAHALNFVLSFVLTTAMFALIYRYMPQVRIEWRDVIVGAVSTALLFDIGKFGIGLYIGKSAFASGFGAAGSFAVLLAWVYYSAQIFLFGAEFTWAYARTLGSHRDQVVTPGVARDPVAAQQA